MPPVSATTPPNEKLAVSLFLLLLSTVRALERAITFLQTAGRDRLKKGTYFKNKQRWRPGEIHKVLWRVPSDDKRLGRRPE